MSSGLEEWDVHSSCAGLELHLLQLWPIIEELHTKWPEDVIQVDLTRVGQLFNKQGELQRHRLRPTAACWTADNPFPFNALCNDNEVIKTFDAAPHQGGQTTRDLIAMLVARRRVPGAVVLLVNHYLPKPAAQQGRVTILERVFTTTALYVANRRMQATVPE